MTLRLADPFTQLPAILVFAREWEDVLSSVWHYLNDPHQIGNIEVKITAVLEGATVFVLALLLSRTLSKLLQRRIARRAYLDPGLRYTIARLAQYLIITIGVLLSLKLAFKVDLTSIAVLFTALSVGIGFGLQYIAADIASGFILLFERPVRVGDRVTIGMDQGDVQSINLRTTVVAPNDRISIIVPNSKLVRERLINWSYGDPRARIAIPVGVAYNSDIDLVTKTLIKATEDVDNVLRDPAPKVQFLKFGDWSLDFRLLVFTNRPRIHTQIRSDINYSIERLVREAKIEIPFPQTELRLREGTLRLADSDKFLDDHKPLADETP